MFTTNNKLMGVGEFYIHFRIEKHEAKEADLAVDTNLNRDFCICNISITSAEHMLIAPYMYL